MAREIDLNKLNKENINDFNDFIIKNNEDSIKTKNIKDLYRLIMSFEEELRKQPIPKYLKARMDSIRNIYSNVFEKEIYDI